MVGDRCENCGVLGVVARMAQATYQPWLPNRRFFPQTAPRTWLLICAGCAEYGKSQRLFVVEPLNFGVNLRELILGKEV